MTGTAVATTVATAPTTATAAVADRLKIRDMTGPTLYDEDSIDGRPHGDIPTAATYLPDGDGVQEMRIPWLCDDAKIDP
jgi:hypothetical protein